MAWQATTFALVAALAGVPVGIAAGRWAWRLVADQLGVAAGPVVPTASVLAIVVGALLAAQPGRRRPWLGRRPDPARHRPMLRVGGRPASSESGQSRVLRRRGANPGGAIAVVDELHRVHGIVGTDGQRVRSRKCACRTLRGTLDLWLMTTTGNQVSVLDPAHAGPNIVQTG
jgi:hypothetical protein